MKGLVLLSAAFLSVLAVTVDPAFGDLPPPPGNVTTGSIGTVQVGSTSVDADNATVTTPVATVSASPSLGTGGTGGNSASDSVGTVQVGGGNSTEHSIGTVQTASAASKGDARSTARSADNAASTAPAAKVTPRASRRSGHLVSSGNSAERSIVTVQAGHGNTAGNSVGTVQVGSVKAGVSADVARVLSAPADLLRLVVSLTVASGSGNTADRSVGTVQVGGGNGARSSVGTAQIGSLTVKPDLALGVPALGLDAGLGGTAAILGGSNDASSSIGTAQIGGLELAPYLFANLAPLDTSLSIGGSGGIGGAGGNEARRSIGTVQIGGGNSAVGSVGTTQAGPTFFTPLVSFSSPVGGVKLQPSILIAGSGGNSVTGSIGTVQVGGGNTAGGSIGTIQVAGGEARPAAPGNTPPAGAPPTEEHPVGQGPSVPTGVVPQGGKQPISAVHTLPVKKGAHGAKPASRVAGMSGHAAHGAGVAGASGSRLLHRHAIAALKAPPVRKSTLPFTGLALGLAVLLALLFGGAGLLLRRAGHATAG